jgi:UDP-GlcNAc:undecaprenyl-phosphate GlcNAc-1-phosphate transferase
MSPREAAVRYAASFTVAFVATLVLTPAAGRLARRWGILDQPTAQKFHGTATPYLGGLSVAIGLLAVGAVTAGASGQVVTIMICALAISALGFVDDWRTVGPMVKVVVESGAGMALWAVGVRAGLFGVAPLDFVLTVAWVVVVTNAMNILDNMDGIASGVSALAALTFFVIAAQRGDFLVGSFALAVAGASLGFLRYNYPPAKIFLGDGGSLLLGFLLSAMALKLDLVGVDGLIRGTVAILVMAVPLFDMTLVVISRLRGRRPIYIGGTDHSAHRMARLGWSHRRVAATLYLVQGLCCAVAVWLTHLRPGAILPVIAVEAALALVGLLLLLRLEAGTEEIALGQPDIQAQPDLAGRLT